MVHPHQALPHNGKPILPQQVIYLGDTAGDQAAAAGAGIPFVHAAYGFGAVPDAALRIPALPALPALTARCLPV